MLKNIQRWISKFFASKIAIILMLILASALILRLWGIQFGLPYLYHDDEGREVIRAMQLGAGSFNLNRIAKGGYFYLLFFLYAVSFIFFKLLGIVNSSMDFALLFIKNPTFFYLIGRSTTAIIGTINVLVIYFIGRKLYSTRVGLIAALSLSACYLHAQSSHYITVDVPMTCLITIGLLYTIGIYQTGKSSQYVLGAIFAGFAIITKAPAIVILIPIFVSHAFWINKEGLKVRQLFFGKNFVISLAIIFFIVAIGNPGIIFKYEETFSSFLKYFFQSESSTLVSSANELFSANEYNLSRPNLFLYYLEAIKISVGLMLLPFILLGIGYGLYERKKENIILISFLFVYYLMISGTVHSHHYYSRYIIPILPILVLFGAYFFVVIIDKFFIHRSNIWLVVFALLLIFEPGLKIIKENYLISQKDTRTYAYEWIEENLPNGAVILIEGSRTKAAEATVPLKNSPENYQKIINYYKKSEVGKAKYFQMELKILTKPFYNLITVADHHGKFNWRELEFFKKIGVQYLVLRPNSMKKKGSRRSKFYSEVKNDMNTQLIKVFKGSPINIPGPIIEIYQIM